MRIPALPAMAIRECRIDGVNYFVKGIVAYHAEISGACVFIPQDTFQSYDTFMPLTFLMDGDANNYLLDTYGVHTKCLCCLISDMKWITWDERDFQFMNNLALNRILCQLEEEVAH